MVRRAGRLDVRQMAELLNEIAGAGGTAVVPRAVTADELYGSMRRHRDTGAWHVAEDECGTILGFQYIEPQGDLPPEACNIATFVRPGRSGLDIGSALFEASTKAARALGYRWIGADIRADNHGGLIYYQSRGFEAHGRVAGQNEVAGKRRMRYDLSAGNGIRRARERNRIARTMAMFRQFHRMPFQNARA
ncbi:Acetyltransferase (GNAT) family protein [Roseivivax lentus]|uniref:Acetyltransferase (GNAT) family protein n=1 Tax=Roseivivax lentus TaxID=633194 RepID=A0A1N7JQ70_9RHOB|nr:GNAT family N-acetyltransferase [Roseivivax lentus]SIS51503.1 Acetyltransferase (GNAT) family protein [Roseivivax lentus]